MIIDYLKDFSQNFAKKISENIKSLIRASSKLVGIEQKENYLDFSKLIYSGWTFLCLLPICFIFCGPNFPIKLLAILIITVLILHVHSAVYH